jgi:hypothetical protein
MFKESRYTLTAEELGHVFVYPEFGAILKYGRKWVVEHDNPAYDWALTKAQARILERLKERFGGWRVVVEILENRVRVSLKGDPDHDALVLWRDGGVSGSLLEELTPKSRPWWARFLGR